MTEEAAKKKWCPQAIQSSNREVFNRGDKGEIHGACLCLASECMMWRWNTEMKGFGHCGLGGKP